MQPKKRQKTIPIVTSDYFGKTRSPPEWSRAWRGQGANLTGVSKILPRSCWEAAVVTIHKEVVPQISHASESWREQGSSSLPAYEPAANALKISLTCSR